MAVSSASLWLLVLLGVSLHESCIGASSHSLKYFYISILDPSQGEQPHFVLVGYVDDQVFVQYDSHSQKMKPRASWMEKVGKDDPQYWDRNTQRARGKDEAFRGDLENLRSRYNQSEGLHTWQQMYGCELQRDKSKRGFKQYGYKGRTFITFDVETLTWVAPDPQAQITQREWDAIPLRNQYWKYYLEEICIEWLEKYLSYGKETLLRTETPKVTVSSRTEVEDGMETHICRVDGFYPREIDASWRRDGEVWLEETFHGSVAPNADGTYHYWLSVRIDPKERSRYRCHVEHDGLQEPLDLELKEPTNSKSNLGLIVGCVVAALVLACAIAGILVFFKRRQTNYNAAPSSLSHSLCYSYLHLSEPSQGPPQSFIGGYLDDQPISRFDSHTRKMEPLVSWVKEVEEGTFLPFESVFRADLEKLSKLGRRAGGLHTLQAILGCEIKKDGNKGGFLRYGYNRWDIISFKNETLRLGAAQPQAEKVKQEDDPEWSEKVNVFLEKTCFVWLQRYLSYRKEAVKRAEPPVGKVTRKEVDDSLEILICQASGFYLKEIQATWMRDKEVWNNETPHRNVAPNSDGTYYVRLSTKINPKERQRFRCRLEHEGLQEPLVLAWEDKTAIMWWIPVAIVAAINVGLWILFLRAQGILWQLEVPEGSGSRSANMTQARKESAVAQKVELLSRAVGDV